jgi:hypothetical protein
VLSASTVALLTGTGTTAARKSDVATADPLHQALVEGILP